MKHRTTIAIAAAVFLIGAASATAGSRYIISNTRQIKPSVIAAIARQVPSTELNYVTGPDTVVGVGEVGGAKALCPEGEHALSGGGFASIAGIASADTLAEGSFIIISNNSSIPLTIHATTVCASEGRAIVASHRTRHFSASALALIAREEKAVSR